MLPWTARTHRTDLFEPADYIDTTDVARMPYLVAVLEMGGETRVPTGMGVGKYAYSFQNREKD